jgi:hypothetical protein
MYVRRFGSIPRPWSLVYRASTYYRTETYFCYYRVLASEYIVHLAVKGQLWPFHFIHDAERAAAYAAR